MRKAAFIDNHSEQWIGLLGQLDDGVNKVTEATDYVDGQHWAPAGMIGSHTTGEQQTQFALVSNAFVFLDVDDVSGRFHAPKARFVHVAFRDRRASLGRQVGKAFPFVKLPVAIATGGFAVL